MLEIHHLEELLRLKREGNTALLAKRRLDVIQSEQFRQLDAEILELEREIAKAKGGEYAVEFPLLDFKAYMPGRILVLGNTLKCFLVLDHGVTVQFNRAKSYKYEGINDEVLEGHRLAERGLRAWKAFIIENSRW